ncbi:DUF3306 domain-containing protein [Hydrogenophaga atypica]|uniref:DUF3306 domain-containing protein n=1 Tax=Hydrogenophaga atypica TaxID=249409 RepID=A0ABW2QK62_9BURK
MSTDDGFFSRWSRRKAQVRGGEAVPEPTTASPAAPSPAQAPTVGTQGRTAPAAVPAVAPAPADTPATEVVPAAPPAPTLQDTEALTPASDFSRFVARDVAPDVRNAAVKKLFADPHFNVMDGLDIYIDDYSKPDPLPLALARKLTSAQFMKVFDAPEQAPEAAPQDAPQVPSQAASAKRPEPAAADNLPPPTEPTEPHGPPA